MRARRLLSAALAVALVPVLVSTNVTAARADTFVAPDPIVVPTAFEGAATTSGVAAGEIGGPQAAFLFMAGVGAFQYTCNILGKIVTSQSCGQGWSNILHWAGFGSSGDARSANTASTAAFSALTCNGSAIPSAGMGSCSAVYNTSMTGSQAYGYKIYETCYNTSTLVVGSATQITASYQVGTGSRSVSISGCGSGNAVQLIQFIGDSTISTPGYTNVAVSGTVYLQWLYDVTPNAPWTVTHTVTCRKPDGTTATGTATQTFTPSANYVPPNQTVPTCDTILPGGHVQQIVISGGRTGITPPDYTITMPTFNASGNAYPACSTGSVAPCKLDLRKDGLSCYSGAWCAGWMDYQSRMTCWWGPYSVALSVCITDLATAFDLQTDPNATPSASPSGAAIPSAGVNPNPSTGVTPTVGATPIPPFAPDTSDTNGANCLGGAWSWNPVQWVYVPMKCALKWAFVPDTATLESFVTTVKTAYDATAIGEWLTAAGSIGGGLSVPSGCDGISADVPIMVTTAHLHIFATCDPPWSTVATVVKGFATVAIAWFSLAGVFRIIASSFGLELSWGRRSG